MRAKLSLVLVSLLVGVLLATNSYAAQAARLITGADIKNGTVTTRDVKDRSLLVKDFKDGQLPAGPQGVAGPAGPVGPSGTAGQAARTTFSSASVVPTTDDLVELPGLAQTVTVPQGGRVYVSVDGGLRTTALGASDVSATDIVMYVNGQPAGEGKYAYRRVWCQNLAAGAGSNGFCLWNMSLVLDVPAGPVTVTVKASRFPGAAATSEATVGGGENSVNRAALTTLVLRS